MRAPLQPTRIVMMLAGVAACYGAGRLTRPSSSAATPTSVERAVEVARSLAATTAATPAAHPLVRPRDHRPADFTPSEYDKQLLATDDRAIEDFVAHGLRDEVIATCHSSLPTATDATCEGVYQATARVSPKFADTRKRLLRGEISADEFQALWHHHFLEREIALEQFMTWDDLVALEGVPPGNDVFMTLNRWGVDAPEDYKIGFANPPEVAAGEEP